MHDHQEIELKWSLTAEAHDQLLVRLVSELGPAQVLEQENSFFDTADLRLRKARMNLRLRRENGRIVLTCKHKSGPATATIQGGLSEHREWECELAPELAAGMTAPDVAWSAALPLPEPVREALAGQPLNGLGGFANRRHEFHANRAGLDELLCLDRTDYVVRTDHELEIETTDPVATGTFWRAQLAAWDIRWADQTLTKFARFLGVSAQS